MAEHSSTTERMQLAALASLAEALTALASRVRSRSVIAQEFVHLNARAKLIAAQAWDVQTSRWAFEENTGRLVDALAAFADEAQSAATRTIAMVSNDAGIVDALLAHAERIGRLQAEDAGSTRQCAIRAELAPLEKTLVTLQARIGEERRVSEDAAALAKEAVALAAQALQLRHGGRAAEQVAHQIHIALTAFGEDATSVSRRIAHSTQGMSDHAVRTVTGTRDAMARPVQGSRAVDSPRVVEGPRPGVVWTRAC